MVFSTASTLIALAILVTLFLLAYFLLPITMYLLLKMCYKAKLDAFVDVSRDLQGQDTRLFKELYTIYSGTKGGNV